MAGATCRTVLGCYAGTGDLILLKCRWLCMPFFDGKGKIVDPDSH